MVQWNIAGFGVSMVVSFVLMGWKLRVLVL